MGYFKKSDALDFIGYHTPTSGCSFKSLLKVGAEESIANAQRITDHKSGV
jgi:hypothetical protein